jgi:hypothetical protein
MKRELMYQKELWTKEELGMAPGVDTDKGPRVNIPMNLLDQPDELLNPLYDYMVELYTATTAKELIKIPGFLSVVEHTQSYAFFEELEAVYKFPRYTTYADSIYIRATYRKVTHGRYMGEEVSYDSIDFIEARIHMHK